MPATQSAKVTTLQACVHREVREVVLPQVPWFQQHAIKVVRDQLQRTDQRPWIVTEFELWCKSVAIDQQDTNRRAEEIDLCALLQRIAIPRDFAEIKQLAPVVCYFDAVFANREFSNGWAEASSGIPPSKQEPVLVRENRNVGRWLTNSSPLPDSLNQ